MSSAFVRIALPLSLLVLLVAVSDACLPHKVHEVVVNNLDGNKLLILHCKEMKGQGFLAAQYIIVASNGKVSLIGLPCMTKRGIISNASIAVGV
ncbi:hypothetical protein E2542_SST06112 [Spatholobus suberectus]|nr:hypothetical protein E2542_SST06112 [Spatholobus suberectus]